MESTDRDRQLFVRSDDKRVLTGVAGGLAEVLGVDPLIVRVAFVLMALGAGAGVLLYAIAFALSAGPGKGTEVKTRPVTAGHTAGVLCIAVGILTAVQMTPVGLPPGIIVPPVLLIVGSVILWARLDEHDRARLARDPVVILVGGRWPVLRLVVGGSALIAGVVVFLANTDALASTQSVGIAMFATTVGLLLLFGPWLGRLVHQVSDERRERIRTEERAEMSAHLHDSVLNTLALIQRSDATPEVVTLARRQERELRAWMQGRAADESDRLDAAIDALATRVESQYNVSVDVVVVGGDTPMDESISAFVSAIQEAVVNAARHSGGNLVSVYIEAEHVQITGFVRDQGRGFDRSAVSSDRRGIIDSIESRMHRAGGRAAIRSKIGEGTEVELRLPRPTR